MLGDVPLTHKPKDTPEAVSLLSSTATNSNRSTPACSPVLRKRSRSATPQLSPEAESIMVEKGSSDQASDRSPTTPEQLAQQQQQQQPPQHQRSYSHSGHPTNTSTRSSGKNSKVGRQTYILNTCMFVKEYNRL